ncbi:prophage tail fiber N-terminal domain-containing protein [Escherichia coli]|uniref:prophage tail fiber N-terminal domain and S74 family endopeptidase-containing protein n=2 Tax=Escherichia coli TaxID=562 RepID=UPI001D183200|nr:prophage tail fiber N-terminal domain and S74 family endopeptidase-containing protein [Escherichia coli]MCC4170868.1 prophage tail fiber N-terminal domain-containing protein [Escherichia coli]UTJ61278.1 prophage tail fiber N-terminal domain-containing protein [Escherichia coli]
MAVKISGVLKDGTGKPVQNCTIQLKAKRNSTTVVVNTLASENPDEAGRYSMDVEYGQYSVILLVEGFPPSHAGTITVYEDSQPGTLNDFLGAMTEDDARPEALRRFELMVEEVARNASAVAQNTAAAKKSASDASTSASEAATHATDAAGSARAASTSAGQAASSAQSASSSAGTASTKATEASKSAAAAESSKSAAATSAAAAKTSETNAAASQQSAATSASAATTKASEAATSARDAAASKEAAKSSETRAASSAGSAASSATAAGNSAKAAKTSETNADNSAQAAADSQTASANSATAAKKSETNAKTSEAAAKSSETNAKASETNAKSSETNAAKSAADALNYRNQAQGIVGNNIGLGASPRDCPDISGNPSGYIGFMRIMASAKGFPSIASGESSLTGFISQVDGSPAYTGIFQGWASRSLYTYRWSTGTGPQWTRHARKDEVSRFSHSTSERTVIFSSDDKSTGCYLQLDAGGRWGYYSPVDQNWKPLAIEQGGTGARDAATARTNLGVGTGNDPQFRNLKLFRITDVTTGWVAGGQLTSKLLSTSGDQRIEGIFYAETSVSSPSQATIKISTPSEGAKYFSFNTRGQILAETAIFRSTYSNPLVIQSTTPTINFNETDRPSGAPYYNLVVDGGNWRIQKNGDGYNGEYVIGYNYKFDEIELPNLKVINNATFTRIYNYDSAFSKRLGLNTSGTVSKDAEIYLWGESTRPTVLEFKLKEPGTNKTCKWLFYGQLNADDTAQLQVNGAVNCTTVNQSSDRDLKDNIQVIGDATEAIRKMNGYTYTLKENGLPYAGVIAQEVMEAIPEAVGSFTHYGEELQGPTVDGNELREETRYLNVDYSAVTGLLVQVARETDDRVTALEEENTTLRENLATAGTRITTLENQVSELVALVRQLTGSEH